MALIEVLELVGDTPLKEPELAEALEQKSFDKSKIIDEVVSRMENPLDIDQVPAEEVAEFYAALHDHVLGVKNKEGAYKTTPETESYDLPTFRESERIAKLGEDMVVEPDLKKRAKLLTELYAMVWEVTGLDPEKLTPWEQELVASQIFEGVKDIGLTAMGKPLST
jgi:hypothetical protein